jgi:outer membrane protein assembly factor BamE (lipoprotein component of BamABCDE complex)
MRLSFVGGNPSEAERIVKLALAGPEEPPAGLGVRRPCLGTEEGRQTMSMTLKTLASVGGLVRLAGACGLIALAAGVLPGCIIAVGGTKHVIVTEPPVEQSRLDQIRLGVTTEEQARAILGAPTTRVLGDNDSQVWTYTGSTNASGKTVVYIDEDDDEIRTEQVRRARVTVEFRDGVVTAVRKD